MADRTGVIWIKSGSTNIAKITVTQQEGAVKYFYFDDGSTSATTKELSALSGDTSVTCQYVTSYDGLTTATTSTWITGATLNNGTLTVNFTANPDSSVRTGTMYVKYGDDTVGTLTVTQAKKMFFLWSNNSTAYTQTIAATTTTGGTSYTTNMAGLTVESAASYSWITSKSLSNPDGNGTFGITAQSNTVEERTAVFNIKNGTTTVGTFTLKQSESDNNNRYLTLVPSETLTFTYSGNTSSSTIQYSRDNGVNWVTVNHNGSIAASSGEKILLKSTTTPAYERGIGTIKSNGSFNVEGNAMSLVYGDNFTGQTTLPSNYSLSALFDGNTKIVSAEKMVLPATTLTTNCYEYMFRGCTNLTKAPTSLPATALVSGCYNYMFQNCTSLTATPTMSVTTFAHKCCCGMFSLCSSLTSVPSSIGTASSSVAASACTDMFLGCSSLTSAPALPATTVGAGSYYGMFSGCTSFTNSSLPALPATTIGRYCYYGMFWGCSGITAIPSNYLPATALAEACYADMFVQCTSLATVPSDLLPATALASHCYAHMFESCNSLRTAPDLPAATVPLHGYFGMFKNCSSLNYIKCLATNITAVSATTDWVQSVSATGTFVKTSSMNSWQINSKDGIPVGWTVEVAEPYFYIGKSVAAATGTAVTVTCASADTQEEGAVFAETVFYDTNLYRWATGATNLTLVKEPSSMFKDSGTWINNQNNVRATDPNGVQTTFFVQIYCYDNTSAPRTGTLTIKSGSTVLSTITVEQEGVAAPYVYVGESYQEATTSACTTEDDYPEEGGNGTFYCVTNCTTAEVNSFTLSASSNFTSCRINTAGNGRFTVSWVLGENANKSIGQRIYIKSGSTVMAQMTVYQCYKDAWGRLSGIVYGIPLTGASYTISVRVSDESFPELSDNVPWTIDWDYGSPVSCSPQSGYGDNSNITLTFGPNTEAAGVTIYLYAVGEYGLIELDSYFTRWLNGY